MCFELHKIAKRDCNKYELPYRCYYNYLLDRAHHPSNKLMLNPCYPEPGYPIEWILKVDKNDFDIPKELIGSRTIDPYTYDNLKPEVKEQVNQIRYRFSTWGAFDEKWHKIFGKYIANYDFESFTCFDFYGCTLGELNTDETSVTQDDIELLQRVYNRFATKYKENPNIYRVREPEYRPEFGYLYYDEPFVMKLTKDELQQKIDTYKAMNLPMSQDEIEALEKLYGVSLA